MFNLEQSRLKSIYNVYIIFNSYILPNNPEDLIIQHYKIILYKK